MSVRDHGAGVAESLVPTLFSRLRTLGRYDRDRARGTGLGLAIVRGLVEAMGGRVWYKPASGGGATFFLALPAPRMPLMLPAPVEVIVIPGMNTIETIAVRELQPVRRAASDAP